MRTAWSSSFRAGMTTIKSTSLSSWGVPQAREPNRMILSGWNWSAICRAYRRITRIGMSAPE
jgi:hypothetical protein